MNMTISKYTFFIFIIITILGCQTTEERRASYKKICQEEFGFSSNSNALKKCIYDEDRRYQDKLDKEIEEWSEVIGNAIVGSTYNSRRNNCYGYNCN